MSIRLARVSRRFAGLTRRPGCRRVWFHGLGILRTRGASQRLRLANLQLAQGLCLGLRHPWGAGGFYLQLDVGGLYLQLSLGGPFHSLRPAPGFRLDIVPGDGQRLGLRRGVGPGLRHSVGPGFCDDLRLRPRQGVGPRLRRHRPGLGRSQRMRGHGEPCRDRRDRDKNPQNALHFDRPIAGRSAIEITVRIQYCAADPNCLVRLPEKGKFAIRVRILPRSRQAIRPEGKPRMGELPQRALGRRAATHFALPSDR